MTQILKEKKTVSIISRCVLPVRTAIMLALALAFFATLPNPAVKAQSARGTFNVGKITLASLLDHPGAHDVKLFSGASPEVMKALAPTGQAASSINAFLVQTNGKNVLIDTGLGAKSGGELVRNLALLGLSPADIDIILITHMHFDHSGGLSVDGKAVYPKAVLKISDMEQGFWLAPDASDPKKNPYIDFKAAQAAVAPYADRLQAFSFGDEVAPGITAMRAVGHTPGHAAFMIESEGSKVLAWGDTVHAIALQLPYPEIYPAYDYDPVAATATRKTVLEKLSTENIPVAGVHIPYPGVGRITAAPNGRGYTFTPGL
jgi:glyoxylase-like metal-dependent hydrolase (beta-lactamase superfamily II)